MIKGVRLRGARLHMVFMIRLGLRLSLTCSRRVLWALSWSLFHTHTHTHTLSLLYIYIYIYIYMYTYIYTYDHLFLSSWFPIESGVWVLGTKDLQFRRPLLSTRPVG